MAFRCLAIVTTNVSFTIVRNMVNSVAFHLVLYHYYHGLSSCLYLFNRWCVVSVIRSVTRVTPPVTIAPVPASTMRKRTGVCSTARRTTSSLTHSTTPASFWRLHLCRQRTHPIFDLNNVLLWCISFLQCLCRIRKSDLFIKLKWILSLIVIILWHILRNYFIRRLKYLNRLYFHALSWSMSFFLFLI